MQIKRKCISGPCEISGWMQIMTKKANYTIKNSNNFTEGVEKIGAGLNNLGKEWNLINLKAKRITHGHSTTVNKLFLMRI